MVITGWSVKGGSGTTVLCAAIAATAAARTPTVLLDLCGDAPALFGRNVTARPGLLTWANADPSVGPESLSDLIDNLEPGQPDLLQAGDSTERTGDDGPLPADTLNRLHAGLDWLAGAYGCVVIDAGQRVDSLADALVAGSDVAVLVVRACSMSLRQAIRSPRSVMGAVVIDTTAGGGLTPDDVEALLGIPLLAHVPPARQVPVAVDAGSFARRVPRPLRPAASAVLAGAGFR